jgi:hypothetical protein
MESEKLQRYTNALSEAETILSDHIRRDGIVIHGRTLKDWVLDLQTPANRSPGVRMNAAEKLSQLSGEFKSLISALSEAAKDPDDQYARYFADEVLKILETSKPVNI